MARRPPAVARVLERVTATAREHDMFSPGDKVLVAASGGPDSTCLLHSLYMLRRLFKIELEVFHFDHRLRRDSGKDAQYVKRMSAKLGLPFHLRVADSKPSKGESIEDWAHWARNDAILDVVQETRIIVVATGHTLDDQAETVLLRLIRGGGLEQISGIWPRMSPYRRPMIDVKGTEVEAFVRALRLRPKRDPTNRDVQLLRNALRHKGIPALERSTGRKIKEPIARTARLLYEDARFLRQLSELDRGLIEAEDAGLRLQAGGLAAAPRALARRLIQWAGHQLAAPLTERNIADIVGLASSRPGARINLPGGLIAVREKEYVRLSRTSPGESVQREKGGSGRERSRRNQGSRVARAGDAS
jgi:tRNA(Ile)-lysidine synthase